jgi:hypothetical protein
MPDYKMKVDFPNRPEGDDIEVTDVGTFKNGEVVDITVPEEKAQHLANTPGLTVQGVEPEPLEQEKKNSEASVEVPKENPTSPPAPDEGGEE